MTDLIPRPGGRPDTAQILVMALVGFLASGVQGIAIPLLSRFPHYLDAPAVDTAWVLTATLLVAVVSTPIAGRVADMAGKRKVLISQLVIVFVGSVLVALGPGLWWVIAGRGLQGVALGMVPVGLGLLRDSVQPRHVTRAIVVVSAGLGLGGAVGHVVAAAVAEVADWRLVFAGTGLLAAATLIAVLFALPAGPAPAGGRFDVVGALLLATTLTCTLLVLSKFTVWGWSAVTAGLAVTAGITLIAFVSIELRVAHPIVNLRVLRSRSIALTDVSAFGVGFASFVGFGSLPQLMQAPAESEVGLGLSLLASALLLAIVGVAMLSVTPVTRAAIERFGAQPVLVVGCGLFVATMGFALLSLEGVTQIVIVVTLSGIALGFASSAMPAIIMAAAPRNETASANGVMTVLQSMGSAVAAALAGAIIGGSTVVVDGVAAPTRAAYVELFAIGAAAVAISLVASLSIGRRARRAGVATDVVPGGGVTPAVGAADA